MLAAAAAFAATPREEAREIFAELIAINTTDSAGDNTAAARAIEKRALAAGYTPADVTLVEPGARKGNVVLRLRGHSRARPVLFLAHLDVVEAKRADWTLDPFTLTERDGYFYGRGTEDCKDEVAMLVATFLRLKREGYTPERDLILALTADEEGGRGPNGLRWLLEHRRELIDAEYCLNNDGGGGQKKNGRAIMYNIQAAEKAFAGYHLVARNKGGHSSLPVPDNAIYDAAEALRRLQQVRFPVNLNPVTRAFLLAQAQVDAANAADLKAIVANPGNRAAEERLSKSSYYNALLHTTCVPTMISGGHAANALPQSVDVTINCRLLPQEDLAPTTARLRAAVAGLPVELVAPAGFLRKVISNPPAWLLEMVRAHWAAVGRDVPVTPVMDTGGSDGSVLRLAGIPTYAVSALFHDVDDVRAHGRDERIEVEEFYRGLEFEYRLVKGVGARLTP
jgi:acetylornithine deacetylase/succinyl-diaminopimelate desuccinylase-like protein